MPGARFALPLLLLVLTACAASNWRTQATLATGLCKQRAGDLHVWQDAADDDAWYASCNSGTFRCSRGGFHGGDDHVHCEYLPICGNDGHHEAHDGHYVKR